MAEGRVAMLSEFFPPKPQWTSDNVPDLTGQTIVVTGGNSGIGKETCRVRTPFFTSFRTLPANGIRFRCSCPEMPASTWPLVQRPRRMLLSKN